MSASGKSPQPPYRHGYVQAPARPRCPVCKAGVYSPSGIHPQCAAARYENLERAAQKASLLADTPAAE